MAEKQQWVQDHCDRLRRALMREPRGHADMCGAVLTEPCTEEAHAGVLFMHNAGYGSMSGHGVVAVCTIALERGLIAVADSPPTIVLETPAGLVRARAIIDLVGTKAGLTRVRGVAVEHMPSFVFRAGFPIALDDRVVPVDIAFGGVFYAIVDSEAVGIPLRADSLSRLREAGLQIAGMVETALRVTHPEIADLTGIYGTVFTGMPERSDADLRNLTVFADRQVDRSPSGTATAAVMSVLDAMGLLAPDQTFVHEGLVGTTFRGRLLRRTLIGEHDAIIPEIEGSAWITGEHTFCIDDDDPCAEGFVL